MIFKITFLPARYGDSIWIDYGTDPNNLHHILIDGGTTRTKDEIDKLMAALPTERPHFDLVCVTHIDRDHIEGILELINQDQHFFTVGDFWFNGWKHLPQNPDDDSFGAVQGEKLTTAILKFNLPWNQSFHGKAVMITENEHLPIIELPEGLKITLLSPTRSQLFDLAEKWEDEVRNSNLDPRFVLDARVDDDLDDVHNEIEGFGAIDVALLSQEEFSEDTALANGSSIAFIAEFKGKKILFAGDAYPSTLLNSLNRISPDKKIEIDLLKVSHHGSKGNLSTALLEKITCKKFVFSTSGTMFNHPYHSTVARVINFGGENPELIFNYRSPQNIVWDDPELKATHQYTTKYPLEGSSGITISF